MKRMAFLPMPSYPFGKSTLPENLLDTRTQRTLFTEFLKSDLFESLFHDISSTPRTYLNHYFVEIPKEVVQKVRKTKKLPSTIYTSTSSSTTTISLTTLLKDIKKATSLNDKLLLLQLLLRASLAAVYPPQCCVSATVETKQHLERNATVELRRLCEVCVQLANLTNELHGIIRHGEPHSDQRQCLCLCAEDCFQSKEKMFICVECGAAYHPSCLSLCRTGCDDLVQTELYGYWGLDRGFVCPGCCKVNLFEMNRAIKGCWQISDATMVTWQQKIKRKNLI